MAVDKEPPLKSPCIDTCCLNDDDICVGCFRSLDEILAWSSLDSEGRSKVLDNTNSRKVKLKSF